MTAVYIFVWILGMGWMTALIALAWYDRRLKVEHDLKLQTRAWQEKVDAMRRLQDIEGDA
jgi:hypothetical protein